MSIVFRRLSIILILSALLINLEVIAQNKIVVFQSDFGLKDGAVSAIKGVANSVSNELSLCDLTHEIPDLNKPFHIGQLEQFLFL